MQALWKVCAHITVAPWQCLGAWLATLHLFHRLRAERERESLTFRCFCPGRSIQACHAAGSMQPSMVLDRTMFHLYCSTTWLDQAQRKTPWTARVRVRQRQRERSVERKQHGEAQAEVHGELLSTPPCKKVLDTRGHPLCYCRNTLEHNWG